MSNLDEEQQKEYFDYAGEQIEILKTIRNKNCVIRFLKQDKAEKNLDALYKGMGELLYKHATT
ncbi:hypothetical protein CHH83_01645 [Bacillus sp. 7586-K]|nr:hypothetical protein CHH83_01645 [Bacillus sp. 7586-K]